MAKARSFTGVVFLMGLFGITLRADQTFRSGPAPVTLIELYTSEGCSNCPPAEEWLGGLRQDPGLWRQFVPVAFHVNYWDRLGWRDALASKAFTEREYAYVAAWNAASVYTPCFVRDGKEWRPGGGRPAATEGKSDAGQLTLTWEPVTRSVRVEYAPTSIQKAPRGFDVSVALLGGGIVSDVRKGENAGRKLRHEFVALNLNTVAMTRDSAGTWSASLTLPTRAEITSDRFAIAGWVHALGELTPRQSTGGWLNND